MWQYNYSSELYHHGILGQKWGVRRYQNKDGTRTAAGKQRYSSGQTSSTDSAKTSSGSKKATAKKVAIGVGAAVTVAAAATIYAKNKTAVDSFVKTHADSFVNTYVTKSNHYTPDRKTYSAAKKDSAARKYTQTHKSEILKSAAKLNKYKDYLSDSEVKNAKKNLELTRDLHQIQQDKIRRGANYVQAALAYGTAATAAYNLSKSSLAKDTKKTIEKSRSKSKSKSG